MDDTTIFNNQQPPTQSGDQDQSGQTLTTQDLYGPSTPQPDAASVPQQELQQPAQISTQQDTTGTQQAYGTQAQPQTYGTQVPQETVATGNDPNQVTQSTYPQAGAPAAGPLSALLGNKKFLLIGGIVGGLLILVIVIGIISRLFHPPAGSGYANATINYWGLWEESKTMQSVLADFEKKYPGIKVHYEKQDPLKYKERLLTRIDNATDAPDIFTFHNTWVPTLTSASDNILLPLSTDVISPEEFKENYYPVIQKDLTKNGAIYGLPQGIDTLALFVNKDIFTAAGVKIPETWEDFNSATKTLTVKEEEGKIKTAGAALGTYDNVTHAPDIIALLMATNGVDLNALDKQQNLLTDTFAYYISFAKNNDKVWDNTLSNSRDMFASGNLAMYFGYSWDIFIIQAINKDLELEVHPVPYLPKEGSTPNKLTIASYWANGVSKKSKHQKEALLLLKYLAQKDVTQKIYTESSKIRLFGMPYARKDLATTLENDPLISPFIIQADYAISSYFVSDTADTLYNGPLNDYLGNAIRQVSTTVSSETAIETLLQGVNQVRAKYAN